MTYTSFCITCSVIYFFRKTTIIPPEQKETYTLRPPPKKRAKEFARTEYEELEDILSRPAEVSKKYFHLFLCPIFTSVEQFTLCIFTLILLLKCTTDAIGNTNHIDGVMLRRACVECSWSRVSIPVTVSDLAWNKVTYTKKTIRASVSQFLIKLMTKNNIVFVTSKLSTLH